jgi:hypothetical protein
MGPTPTTEGISDLGESSCRAKLELKKKNKENLFRTCAKPKRSD